MFMSRLLKTRGRVFNEPVNEFDTGIAGIAGNVLTISDEIP